MIRMLIQWGINRVKVNIRSFSFWLITALMTITFLLSHSVSGRYNEDTLVLVYTGDESLETADELYADMTADTPEGFRYERVYDEEELRRLVSVNEASCGVVFEGIPDEYLGSDDERLAGTVTDRNFDDMHVTIYQAAGSADGYVIREMVYPVLARMRAPGELTEYVNRVAVTDLGSILTGEAGESARYAVERYEMYTQTPDTGIYEVCDIGDPGDTDVGSRIHEERTASILKIVFCAMIILTTVLTLYDTVHTDRNFYGAFSRGKRVALVMVRVLTTVVMSTAFAAAIYGIYQFG